jgi:hypothetical protein
MYLGLKSLTALWFFLHGYEVAKFRCEQGRTSPELPQNFSDWVAYRLHLHSNWSGFWHRAILSRIRDESLALDRFYELRDEHAERQAKVVATIREDRREYQIGRRVAAGGEWAECTERLPRSLRIVVYTEDPGFFLEADDQENFSYRGWFFCALDAFIECPIGDRFVVNDPSTWDRLIGENRRYKRNLERTRARIRCKESKAQEAGDKE